MGIRERLNQNRVVAIVIAAIMILAGVGIGLWQGLRGRHEVGRTTQLAYFSADDGASWFADDASKLPPFDHDGKPAYRVKVFRCHDGKAFVAHLERYAPADKKRMDDLKNTPGGGNAMVMEETTFMQIGEVKRPGEATWLRLGLENGGQALRAMQPKCPDGSTAGIEPVLPK